MAWKEFRVTPGRKVRLKYHDPAATPGYGTKQEAQERLRKGVDDLCELQNMLYAQDRYALLLIFQAMDGAGKDSTIKHVMSGVNPVGCQAYAFKAPSDEELDHDFLWRTNRCLPERGRIGLFNRSYYEEVLVVRVHPEILKRQKLPPERVTKDIWKERFQDIVAMERHLARNGTVIRKFFLHVSKDEQRRRFLERLSEPEKHWKFSLRDVGERDHWRAYERAYEEMLEHTSTREAPWYVIPADHKWFTRMAVADIIVDTLRDMDLHYPKPTEEARRDLAKARQILGGSRAGG
jgi:PPK2 family polyphosphate:nucleotide phosphotransferase